MKFWEDFFSTDKIIYPAIGAFLIGLCFAIGSILLKNPLEDIGIAIFMGIGFVLGNMVKVQKIQEQREKEEAINRKNKKIKTKK